MNEANNDFIRDEYVFEVSNNGDNYDREVMIELIVTESEELSEILKNSPSSYIKEKIKCYMQKLGEIYDNFTEKIAFKLSKDLSEIYIDLPDNTLNLDDIRLRIYRLSEKLNFFC